MGPQRFVEMSFSLADQLATIRIYPMLLTAMRRFGVISSWDASRGFGEIELPSVRQRMFCHISGRLGAPGRPLRAGDPVLFLIGSDPRKPDHNRAVRWVRVEDVPWGGITPPHDQGSLDTLRKEALPSFSLEAIWTLLDADWYHQLWNGKAPSDLEDQLLFDAWVEKIATFDPQELEASGADQRLSRSPYFQCRCGPRLPLWLGRISAEQCSALGAPQASWMSEAATHLRPKLMTWCVLKNRGKIPADWKTWFTGKQTHEVEIAKIFVQRGFTANPDARGWLDSLLQQGLMGNDLLQEWITTDPIEGLRLFSGLTDALQDQLMMRWIAEPAILRAGLKAFPSELPVLLRSTALAIDLESDGEAIWQIGYARSKKAHLPYDQAGSTLLPEALAQLSRLIASAPILVGHNIIEWDWPIIASSVNVSKPPLMWDTLLVSFLMRPHARSHALGGSHRADQDALQTLELFSKQLQSAAESVLLAIVSGEYKNAAQLLEGLAVSMNEQTTCHSPSPQWLQQYGVDGIAALPAHMIRELDWVPGVKVMAPDTTESLPLEYLEVDASSLALAMQAYPDPSPAAVVIKHVLQRADQQGISVRYNMLPPWLLDRTPDLDLMLRRSLRHPAMDDSRCVSLRPHAVKLSTPPPVDVQHLGRACLVAIPQAQGAKTWFCPDPAAMYLERAQWRTFSNWMKSEGDVEKQRPSSMTDQSIHWLIGRDQMLHPGSIDQMSYWSEVLRAFRECARSMPEAVPILLVGSSASTELLTVLQTTLAELKWGAPLMVHLSRSERLKRASRKGLALVDTLAAWPAWLSLAQHLGVKLLPVVESLPVEQWFAATFAASIPDSVEESEVSDAQMADDFEQEVDDPDDSEDLAALDEPNSPPAKNESEVTVVTTGEMLSVLPKLLETQFSSWMLNTGLAASVLPVSLLDSRISLLGKALEVHGKVIHLKSASLSPNEESCLNIALDRLKIHREFAPSDLDSMEQFLVSNWKPVSGGSGDVVSGFKATQRAAIEAICTRQNDVLVTLPTGEGKSVLFQVPALCRGLKNRRLTLVLSPLKALMRDQVESLSGLGFAESVDYMSSDRSPEDMADVVQGVLDHRIILLYVAPERLRSASFINMLRQRHQSDGGLEYIVVDETHCVNQWGYEFRPDYFHALDQLLSQFRMGHDSDQAPILLLSATITSSDRHQLSTLLSQAQKADLPAKPLVIYPEKFSAPLRAHIRVDPKPVKGMVNDRNGFELNLKERLPLITQVIDQSIANGARTGQRSAVLVFVSKRDQAEQLAVHLRKTYGARVDYFHAGLDAITREEVYQAFRGKGIDILVATKAFGMGMDIPDIHGVVHLSPPSFLEDYLQEVGRMGRGEHERKKAGLSKLIATLLYSGADFERMRAQRARGALRLPFIKDQLGLIAQNAYQLGNSSAAVVPQDGFDPPDHPAARRQHATKLRLALYWLERDGCLQLCGTVPNLLTISIHRPTLVMISHGGGPLGTLAKLILEGAVKEDWPGPTPASDQVPRRADTWLGSALESIANLVGVFVGASRSSAARPNVPSQQRFTQAVPTEEEHVILNLPQLMMHSGLATLNEVVSRLVDLEQRGGVKLQRTLQFSARSLADEPSQNIDALFDVIENAAQRLTRSVASAGVQVFAQHDLFEGFELVASDPKKSELYRSAAERGSITLARLSGVRIRQITDANQEVRSEAKLTSTRLPAVLTTEDRILRISKALFSQLAKKRANGSDVVSLSELVKASRTGRPNGRYSAEDVKRALSLLSSMKLMSISAELLPQSYILTVNNPDRALDDNSPLWKELDEVNLLAERRGDAMEVFANLPGEAQSKFIEGYFEQTTAQDLESFLDTQLGELDDSANDDASSFIRDKRTQLQANAAKVFFERYQTSEEPNQWKAICHPYNEHLLVNAGPGSGKTSVLVGRIVHLIRAQHVAPNEIIVLAFNRAVVFEIKKRIRDLFKTLGYGSYVKRVRVYTFHAFARLHLNHIEEVGDVSNDKDNKSDPLTYKFAKRLEVDSQFRQKVVGQCRSILVDEFQDVNEEIYSIIRLLHEGSNGQAGVMVIGDDDQDILRWNRSKKEFSEVYFEKFKSDFGPTHLTELFLKVNFRSGPEIVAKSQQMIDLCLEDNTHSHRLKQGSLAPSNRLAPSSVVDRVRFEHTQWDQIMNDAAQRCVAFAKDKERSLAILCKSNAEVAALKQLLGPLIPDLRVQSNNNTHLTELRHIGLWLELLHSHAERENAPLDDALKHSLIDAFRSQQLIPECTHPRKEDIQLDTLWDLCCQEQSYPHLTDLIQLIEALKTDELERMQGIREESKVRLISTIHKVKGLEFDRVIVMPSITNFPFSGDDDSNAESLAKASAEEARLLYVAMTRAKEHLTYYLGDREHAWWNCKPFIQDKHVQSKILQASHEEIWLDWPLQSKSCQDYIERYVRVGDVIEVNGSYGNALFHQGHQGQKTEIGRLAKKYGRGNSNSSLVVSAVVRRHPKRQPNGEFDSRINDSVRDRGWGYIVLVSGQLR